MATLDSAAFLARARAAVGSYRIPQGMCLNFVWTMAGAVQSIPPALGRMDTAQHSWDAVEEADRVHGDLNPPAGVPAFFGPSPTRTDRNKDAGDIVVSIGGGMCIATDANGAYVGIMTLTARARQIQRPYLGWSKTLGGHRFSAVSVPVTPTAVVTAASTIGVPTMGARVIRVESTRKDGSYDEGFANPDTRTWDPIGDGTQARIWRAWVGGSADTQPRKVLSGFTDLSTGKKI